MKQVHLYRKPDDSLCVRVSAGGWADKGYYCVIRLCKGQTQADVAEMLEAVALAMRHTPALEVDEDIPDIGAS